MKPSKYMDIINEIEQTFNVSTWEIKGIKIWPVVRINLATNLQMDRKHPEIPPKLKMLYRLLLISYEQKKHELKFRKENKQTKKADVVFLSHSVFRTEVHNKWYDRFCDPIRESLNEEGTTSFQYEYVPRRQFRRGKVFPSQYIQSQIDYIKFKYEFKKISIDPSFEQEYLSLKEWLKHKLIDYCLPPVERVVKDMFIINELSHDFSEQLLKMEAKVGLVVYYYGIEGFAFNLACKKLGIPSIDIQHGVQGEYHRAYGRWGNVPKNGYELLPSIFWCWNEEEESIIRKWANDNNRHRVINGGFPWLELWQNPNHPITSSYSNVIKNLENNDLTILVTLQKERKVPELLLETIKISPPQWKWLIRLHPAMMQQFEEIVSIFSAVRDRVEIEQATKLPLYAILATADLHVTEWSSTVIEADALRVPSIIIHPFGYELFHNYVESGKSKFVETTDEFISAANGYSNKEKTGESDIELQNRGITWLKEQLNESNNQEKSKRQVTYL